MKMMTMMGMTMKKIIELFKMSAFTICFFIIILLVFNLFLNSSVKKAYEEGFRRGSNKTCAWMIDAASLGTFGQTATGKTWDNATDTWLISANIS
jgi:hypothetical protein